MQVKVDPHGRLLEPFVHDGYLDGLRVSLKTAWLDLRAISGERFVIELHDVSRLVANDFREGNIVLDILLISGTEPEPDYLEMLDPTPHPGVADHFKTAHQQRLKAAAAAIRNSVRTLCIVTPSYGCTLVAECATYTILPRP